MPMLMLAEAGRDLNKNLISLFRHDGETPQVLERLVHEIHTDKELCSYMFLNHPGSEDMLWGLLVLLDSDDSRVAGNAAFIIGTLAEMDMGKNRVVQLCMDNSEQTQKILPSLTRMLDMVDMETVMNAAGTMGTLAENDDCRMWMLKHECLDDTIDKLTRLLSCKDGCTASNAALVLARLTIAEEGCARILRQRTSARTLVHLCKALGVDKSGRGMNAAFAIGRLCDLEAGCARMLNMPESRRMLRSLIKMLGSDDIGCTKNACFALSCIASFPQGHSRLMAHPDIDNIVTLLCQLLGSSDEEIVWFSAMMLHTLGSHKSGCLYLRKQLAVKPALLSVLERSTIKKDTIDEVEETLAILEKLAQPKAPTLQVESAYTIIVEWEAMNPKSGLDVMFELFQNGELVYEGCKNSYIASGLTPCTTYSYSVRVYTEGDDGHTSKAVTAKTPESVPTAPQFPRVAAKTTNQIKIIWDPPETANGVLKAYQVVTKGKTTYLDASENYMILSGLAADTEHRFEIYALTSKGRGEAALLTTRTDDLASHAPSKPIVQAIGRHEISITWEQPQRPLGRINSFEVKLDDVIIYTGIEKTCMARSLKPNTEYTITVSAWTSEGRCESLPARKRTGRDIYRQAKVPDRKPLYPAELSEKASEKEIKRVFAVPTAYGLTKSDSKPRVRKLLSSADNRYRPNTTSITSDKAANDRNNNSVPSRPPHRPLPSGRRSSKVRVEISGSFDSLKVQGKDDLISDVFTTTKGTKTAERTASFGSRRSTRLETRELKRSAKDPRRNSFPASQTRQPRSPLTRIPASRSQEPLQYVFDFDEKDRAPRSPLARSPASRSPARSQESPIDVFYFDEKDRAPRSPLSRSPASRSPANRSQEPIKDVLLDFDEKDTRPTPSPGDLSDSLTALTINKPPPPIRQIDEKPAKKSTFADSFGELRQVHRTNQSPKRTHVAQLEISPSIATAHLLTIPSSASVQHRLKKRDTNGR